MCLQRPGNIVAGLFGIGPFASNPGSLNSSLGLVAKRQAGFAGTMGLQTGPVRHSDGHSTGGFSTNDQRGGGNGYAAMTGSMRPKGPEHQIAIAASGHGVANRTTIFHAFSNGCA